ncbi:MAG: ROK family protein [Eubacteriales bacterium]|nr:ROK family protein [Eubacteriales bacterium]
MGKILGVTRDKQKELNYSSVIRIIHQDPNASRVSISRQTGLRQATLTKIISDLIASGLVKETEGIGTNVGRKPISLKLDPDKYVLGAMRINREYLTVALYNLCGENVRSMQVDYCPGDTAQTTLNRMKELWTKVAGEIDNKRIIGVGIAVPGPFNARTGRITLMSGFPGWKDVDIHAEMSGHTGFDVCVEHDANCGALAEYWYGNHKREESLVYVLSDTGIGAGLIMNGELYRGTTGFSGEIGHVSINFDGPLCECGNKGCLELYTSTRAMVREYEAVSIVPDADARITTDEFFQLARNGDSIARHIYERATSLLAFGVVGAINTLNPDVVVFADRISRGGDSFLPIVKKVLQQRLIPDVYESVRVEVCHLSEDPSLLGASIAAFEQILLHPMVLREQPIMD